MRTMRRTGSRTVKVKRSDLIEKIKENKKKHIEEYDKAVIAYKEEALKQLEKLTEKANDGKMNLKLDLITPVNVSEDYDKIVEMFEWEVEDVVELSQDEFIQFVQDESDFSVSAKLSNTAYFMD